MRVGEKVMLSLGYAADYYNLLGPAIFRSGRSRLLCPPTTELNRHMSTACCGAGVVGSIYVSLPIRD